MMKISEFKQKGVLEILIWLIEEELMITQIQKRIRAQTAYRAVSVLLSFNLVDIRRGEFNAKYYRLTDKGKKVAAKLAEIEEILQED